LAISKRRQRQLHGRDLTGTRATNLYPQTGVEREVTKQKKTKEEFASEMNPKQRKKEHKKNDCKNVQKSDLQGA
jgi:hypothetical protein